VAAVEALVDARLDEAADHGAREARRREDAAALAELALSVPRAEDVVRADKRRRLTDALEEADRHDGLRVVHRRRHHGEAAPEDHHEREPYPRLDVVQGEVGRNLAQDIAAVLVSVDLLDARYCFASGANSPHGEAGVDLVELVSLEAKLRLHARHVGIGKVGAVQLR